MAKRILLVDDDLYIREIYTEVLKASGFDVVKAEDGKEGLEKIMEGGFDIILLDVMMPEIDGIKVLREIQKNPPKNPNGKIIILTNLSHDLTIEEGLKLGAHSFLIKADIDPPELVAKINEILRSRA